MSPDTPVAELDFTLSARTADLPTAVSVDRRQLVLLDRDQSILAFNARVLNWAQRDDVPLLERLRYLCIVSSNLDEFFEVRAVDHLTAKLAGECNGTTTAATFDALSDAAHAVVAQQYLVYNQVLIPALRQRGIRVISHSERNSVQRRWVQRYFEREVQPLLIPVSLDPAHPFPQVANKSLNFIVRLGGVDAFGRANDIAIVKVPRSLPRLIQLPPDVAGRGKSCLVLLSSVIRSHLQALFPDRRVEGFSQFRLTRHSDLAVDEDDVQDLRSALRQGLQHRHFGAAVRLEVSAGCPENLSALLLQQFGLPEGALYRVHGPVNLVRLSKAVDMVSRPELRFPAYTASFPQALEVPSIFERLRQGDVLIHQPFESFSGVVAFLREAVHDPDVVAIKQTIYRTGEDSEWLALLREAVRRGKEVTAVVELKARFDEEANINWADALESVGAQVVYGVVGLKTHAKMLLVTRREGRGFRRYAHLSTGNYNPVTARLYTDVSHLTADPELTTDMDQVFVHLAAQTRLPRLKRLWLAPFDLHRHIVDKLGAIAAAAARGEDTRVIVKVNALTDFGLIDALVRAGKAGTPIDLVVRGACMLPPGRAGQTDRIRVRSIIGRFLEHSRVFYFRIGDKEHLYLSSADWMNRNMLRRVELGWEVRDPALRQRLIDECLVAYLHDTRDAWTLSSEGEYRRVQMPSAQTHGAQNALMARYAGCPLKGR